MKPSQPKNLMLVLIGGLALSPLVQAGQGQPDDDEPIRQLETVTVTADGLGETTEQTQSYTTGEMKTATKMDLSLRETPQSVSVVTRTKMDDFRLTGINEVLESTTGVTVEQTETDRVYYTARGFDITNFQQDGLGVPLTYTIDYGNADTALYDRVEVVRGASGLMSGAGNPSATINLVRKRPTDEFRASVTTSSGSWDNYRLEGDVSGAINDRVGARAVLVQQTKGSYLDNYSQDKSVLYGITDIRLAEETVLTIGASREDTRSNSPMWGSIPLLYSNGIQTDFDVSTSTAADWSFWDMTEDNAFVELAHALDDNWQLLAVYRHASTDDTAELFYQFGALDMATGQGLFGWPGRYETELDQDMFDVYVTGNFTLAGREHDVVAGVAHAKSDLQQDELTDPAYGFPAIGNFNGWNGNIARPDFVTPGDGADFSDEESGAYVAGRFRLADPLSLVTGARVVDWESEGASYGAAQDMKETGRVIPYAGLVYDIDEHWSAYASYTETFMPQPEEDASGRRLDPADGDSQEIGVKSAWFGGRLNLSLAVFAASHDNLAQYAGFDPGTGKSFYTGEDYESDGFEIELAGELAPGLEAAIGYTSLTIEDSNGNDARTYIPAEMLRSSFSYRLPQRESVKIGARVDWQDETTSGLAGQDSYVLVDTFVSYDISNHLNASLNLNNLTDEKYFNSLQWEQAFYGAPRNVMASLTWKY